MANNRTYFMFIKLLHFVKFIVNIFFYGEKKKNIYIYIYFNLTHLIRFKKATFSQPFVLLDYLHFSFHVRITFFSLINDFFKPFSDFPLIVLCQWPEIQLQSMGDNWYHHVTVYLIQINTINYRIINQVVQTIYIVLKLNENEKD